MNNVHAATVSTLVSARSHVGLAASSLCGPMLARAPGIRQAIAIATLLGGTVFSHSVYASCLTITNPPAPTPSSGGPTLLAGGSYIVKGFGGNVYANTGTSTISNAFVSGAGFTHSVGECVYPGQTVGLGFYTTLGGLNEQYYFTETQAYGASVSINYYIAVSPKNLGRRECPTHELKSCVGNPINAGTGNKFQQETDFAGVRDTHLELRRYYNSAAVTATAFGMNWRGSYDRSVELLGTTLAQTWREDGRVDSFRLSGGSWVADPDVANVLTQLAGGWQLTRRDLSTENYDTDGRLTSIVTNTGLTTTLSYNASHQLTTVTDPFGHTLTFSYYTNGKVYRMTTPESDGYTYAYDSNNNLISVTHPDSSVRQYTYTNTSFPNALTGIIDELGNTSNPYATFAYDTSGRAISSQHAQTSNGSPQERFQVAYTTSPVQSSSQSTVTDPAGNVWVHQFQTRHGTKIPTSIVSQVDSKGVTGVLDANGNVTDVTNEEGIKTHYTYNSSNQRTSMTEAYQTSSARTTEYEYLSSTANLITRVKTPSVSGGTNKKEVITAYNADRTIASITINGFQPDGTPVSRVTSFPQYNSQKQVTQINGPRTDVSDITTLEYYECTTGHECGQLKRITNAAGHITTFDLYDANGRLTQMGDPNGVATYYTYDLRGRVLTITQTQGATSRTTTYTYWGNGKIKTVTLPTSGTLTYGYDDAQDLRSITDDLGNKIEYSYDIRGNRNDEDVKDSGGNLKKWVDTVYDLRNRIDTINAGGSITDLLYDASGELEAEADPNANPTDFNYDPLGRFDTVLDALGDTTDYSFDAQGQLTALTAPNTASTQFVVDDLGNVLKETSPDRGVTLYGYDAAGNVACKSDGRYSGSATSCSSVANRWVYSYDPLNRLTSVDYLVTSGVTDTTLGYDAGTNQKGRLTSVVQVTSGSTVSRTLSYDPFGNVVSATQTVPKGTSGTNKTLTTGFEYNGDNSLKKVTYPSGRIAEYLRDATGRIQQVQVTFSGSTTTYVSNVSWNPFGPPASISYNNGVTQTRTHDEQYRLTNLTLAGGSTLDQLAYTYDPAGNVDYLDDQLNSAYDRDYSYDVLNRLKWDSGVSAGNPTYTYDGNGNRLTRTAGTGFPAQTISYVAGKNRMSTYNSTAVSYDGMGNVTNSGNNLTATTEVNGRLLTATVPNSRRVTLLYNGLGEMARARTETRSGNQWTTPYWEYASFAPDGRALGLIQENTSRTEWEWVWVDNLPVVQFQDSYNSSGTYTGTTVTYLHPDQLGTPRIGTNTAGAISWRYRSDAFGIATISGTHTVRLRLPGQIDLGTGGINYNYFRDYDPNLGRYLEADPIGLDGGLNTYGYVGANPLRHVDPTGEFYSSGHLIVSANALQGSGLSNQVAQEAVAASMGLDFVPGSQTPSSANLHSMTKANQTEADAARQAADFIDAQLARCDATGLGYALHTVQDSVPGGHRFKTYRGILDTILNDPLHFVQDLWPYGDTYTEALTKSQIVVRRFQRDCSCQSE